MIFKRVSFTFLSIFLYSIGVSQPANDNFANAIDVTGIVNGCSADAAYTTIAGTSDLNSGSCWNNSGPRFNVWYKFTATANQVISVTVDVGSGKGTQTGTQVAIWQADGTTQVACNRYATSVWS
ncbi:MAG: hypothetical protein DRI71_05580, partial [Bacteroidetes bacterium]